ncbi:MAG: CBS domain-containing protein [Ruminococcus sp.]|nr:CBS domain-containing protein [Ruminococcus sp.]
MNILKFLKPKAVIDFVYEDYTVRQAIEKMRNHGFTAIPVISKDGGYVKTLAEGDILWFMLDNDIMDIKQLEKYSISNIPRRVKNNPVYIYSTIEDLILLLMNQNFVPVIDDRNMFIGIITRQDILRYCHKTIKSNLTEFGGKINDNEFAKIKEEENEYV